MNFLSLIEAKRDGRSLDAEQFNCLINAYADGQVPDYQMAAFLMAIFFRGLNAAETRAMTLAMRDSGEVLQFPSDSRPLVDKHSTGGVGDKVSLPLAPLLACLGFRVPMISGRGLGITGGTLDKLESIPGFITALSSRRIVEIAQAIGCVMAGPTALMVPADAALYALRDVTGTVPSIPLLTSSILSKKLAENISALVLDVKFGSGASMSAKDGARQLAQTMVTLGAESGVNTRALLTNMDAPLGRSAGNWLEVKESVACLEGAGPVDLRELVIECAAHLLVQTQRAKDLAEGRAQAHHCLASGRPREKWDELLKVQGTDLKAFEQKLALDHTAPVVRDCCASQAGFITRCDARIVGEIVRDLGGGRYVKDTVINPEVGINQLAKPGEAVGPGSVLGRVHAAGEAQAVAACERLEKAYEISAELPELPSLVQEVIQ